MVDGPVCKYSALYVWHLNDASCQHLQSEKSCRRPGGVAPPVVNYLVENREINSQIDYSTGGRPSIKYTKH